MSENPHISLEQWRTLMAVVEAGGYAQAAEVLHKSQSSVTYAVQKLESLLGVKAFEIRGRKAILTPTGQLLYRRARALVEEAVQIERAAKKLSAGWEAEIRLAVEILFPSWLLFRCLDRFGGESPHTRVELFETVLGGTSEALDRKQVDLAIAPRIPSGFLGEPLMRLRFVPVAHPNHPLHKLEREITLQDLRAHRHLVVRDSGAKRTSETTTIDVEQRWTVSNMSTSILAAREGFGFSWYPEDKIREELSAGTLKPLKLRDGAERWADIYLIFADRDSAGPGTMRLAEIIREQVKKECVDR
ncbi:MAG TPA: LysR family transcriptional regulator [Burkholderiales bacterium]|nr:LysR family transcriptional regulator [Burkholderiales bacterium]